MTSHELAILIKARAAQRSQLMRPMTPAARAILDRAATITRQRKIAGRVGELKQLAADTTEAYRQALAASGLPEQHFRLRAMLLSRLLPPPRE